MALRRTDVIYSGYVEPAKVGVRPLFVFQGAEYPLPDRQHGIFLGEVGHEDLVTEARRIAQGGAGTFGLEIFDIQLRRESIGWVLRVFIDRQEQDGEGPVAPLRESVSLEDCQRVSRDLSAVLDADLAFDHRYTLEVSSPGLDRRLRHLDDCRRFVGRLAKIVTTEAIDGQHHIAGRIDRVVNDRVVVTAGTREYEVPWAWVSRARLDIEF